MPEGGPPRLGAPPASERGWGAWRAAVPTPAVLLPSHLSATGYGYSDKPPPQSSPDGARLYSFDTWSAQLRAFAAAVAGGPVFLICNSIGGIAGMQAALDDPSIARGVQIMNPSLRMLHVSKQAPWQRPLVRWLQDTLRTTPVGAAFFRNLATPQSVRSVLRQCYGDAAAVTDELVDAILTPGLQPGAVEVFLDFISYSEGPLPEGQLQALGGLAPEERVPVSVVWGGADPWEKVEWGREFVKYPAVEEFVELPGVGHCPQVWGESGVLACAGAALGALLRLAGRRLGPAPGIDCT